MNNTVRTEEIEKAISDHAIKSLLVLKNEGFVLEMKDRMYYAITAEGKIIISDYGSYSGYKKFLKGKETKAEELVNKQIADIARHEKEIKTNKIIAISGIVLSILSILIAMKLL